jgi:hypothetical protein
MKEHLAFDRILFLDIETVPQTYDFHDLDAKTLELFDAKTRFQRKPEVSLEEMYRDRGGILAEFGKIVCISVGFVHEQSTGRRIRMKSFYHDDESSLLNQFKRLLDDHYNTSRHVLCGHNIKEFDIPYLCRRMLINGIELPEVLNISGKKPWEINHLDTMDMWKFGDYKAYTSLALLCHVSVVLKNEQSGFSGRKGNSVLELSIFFLFGFPKCSTRHGDNVVEFIDLSRNKHWALSIGKDLNIKYLFHTSIIIDYAYNLSF